MRHSRGTSGQRSTRDRFGAALAAAAAVSLLAVPLLVVSGPSTTASAGVTPLAVAKSSLTVPGTGPFSSLAVTVDKTTGLVNQTIKVSWTGGDRSVITPGGTFLTNYLQIMQCWAEPGQQPDREQCQYGAFVDVPQGAANIASRQLTQFTVDPAETEYVQTPGSTDLVYVDFKGVDGTVSTGRRSQFFDAATTNEVPIGRTRPDGTGGQFVEVQTGLDAPGLGCGQVINGRAPDCFLVVVPRGTTEVDGRTVATSNNDPLTSSPLSTTNWANRIVVPLDFVDIATACVLGRPETPTAGSDLITEAITLWQPSLCSDGDRNFGFSSLPDFASRALLASSDPGLVFLNGSVTQPGAVYAPVAISALAVGVNIERQIPDRRPDGRPAPSSVVPQEIKDQEGARFANVNLTPRLVAKLLTQSYKFDLGFGTATNLTDNPFDVSQDPEFLAINPDFTPQGFKMSFPNSFGRMLVQAGLLDSADLVWQYVLSDAEARDFLAGKADPYGMVINERYRSLTLPTDSYPRSDLGCTIPITAPVGFTLENCTLDVYPFAASLQQSARAVSRGETGRRDIARPDFVQTYAASPPQVNGRRSMIGLTDTPSLTRYNVVPVALRNPQGEFVVPSESSMRAAVDAMKPDERGVLVADPAAKVAGAYPLTLVTYAATVPAVLTPEQRADYGRLIRYAVGEGQTPAAGNVGLAPGYLPLPLALRSEATAAAATIEQYKAPTPTPTPTATVTPTPSPSPSTVESSFVPVGPGNDGGGSGVLPSSGGATPTPVSSSPAPTSSPSTTPVAAVGVTPADPASASRLALLAAFVLGMSALFVRTVLPWFASRRT